MSRMKDYLLEDLPLFRASDPETSRQVNPVRVGTHRAVLLEQYFYATLGLTDEEAGARAAYRVDFAGEIDEAWMEGVNTVGLTSGASVPEILVNSVLAWLAERGYTDVEEVETIEEHLIFALPPELRRDIKAAGRA